MAELLSTLFTMRAGCNDFLISALEIVYVIIITISNHRQFS